MLLFFLDEDFLEDDEDCFADDFLDDDGLLAEDDDLLAEDEDLFADELLAADEVCFFDLLAEADLVRLLEVFFLALACWLRACAEEVFLPFVAVVRVDFWALAFACDWV